MRLILRHRLNLVKTSLVALKIVFKTKDFLRNIDVPEQNKMNMSYYKIFMEQFHHFRHVKQHQRQKEAGKNMRKNRPVQNTCYHCAKNVGNNSNR